MRGTRAWRGLGGGGRARARAHMNAHVHAHACGTHARARDTCSTWCSPARSLSMEECSLVQSELEAMAPHTWRASLSSPPCKGGGAASASGGEQWFTPIHTNGSSRGGRTTV